MPTPPSQDDARTQFCRQCDLLGRARDEKTIAEQVAAFGERVDRGLLEQVWEEEQAKRRQRKKDTSPLRLLAMLLLLGASIAVIYWFFRYGKGQTTLAHLFSPFMLTPLVYAITHEYKHRVTNVQRGIARLIPRRGPTLRDVGILLDLAEWEWRGAEDHKEFMITSVAALTRLLPVAVQTDALRLNAYQCDVLRKQISGVAYYLRDQEQNVLKRDVFTPKPADMPADYADYAAAALLALNALGELRGDSKAHRAARAAIQKLADAPAKADEPLNHRYVREVAKETLPLVQVGRSAP